MIVLRYELVSGLLTVAAHAGLPLVTGYRTPPDDQPERWLLRIWPITITYSEEESVELPFQG